MAQSGVFVGVQTIGDRCEFGLEFLESYKAIDVAVEIQPEGRRFAAVQRPLRKALKLKRGDVLIVVEISAQDRAVDSGV